MPEHFDELDLDPAEPVVAVLAGWRATPAPPDVHAAVRRRVAAEAGRTGRSWRPVRVAAAVTAWLYLSQGFVDVVFPHQLADFLGLLDEPHAFREGGFAALAVGVLMAAAVARPRWLEAAMVAGVPLGVVMGAYGLTEITHLEQPAGEVFHMGQAVAAVTLWVLWRRARRRDAAGGPGEGET